MRETLSERRMAENEFVFREFNERVKKGFDELKRVSKEEGQIQSLSDYDSPMQFFCECSDENCRKRIKLKPSLYNKLHERRDHFVIICGHDIKSIEKVVEMKPNYWVVEKFVPQQVTGIKLNKTEADNT